MADDKLRLQLDVTPAAIARIDALQVRLDAGSRAEVVRRALRMLDLVTGPDVQRVSMTDHKGNVSAIVI